MVLQISQETFNDAVKENIDILGLTEDQAVEEAIKQFESQGVDLSKIFTKLMTQENIDHIHALVQQLENLFKTKGAVEAVNNSLEQLRAECDKGLQEKVEAGKVDAYNILLNIYETFKDKSVRTATLKTLISLMSKQPDLLDDRGVTFIIDNLKDHTQDPELERLLLKWSKECCIMHENNRQKIFDAHILDLLKNYLQESTPIEVIREALSLARALVLDDDVRVEFGKAHEHARIIASVTLCQILSLLTRFRGEEQLNFDIILTLTALMVRTEFCKKVQDAGGIDLIKTVMIAFSKNDKIVRQSFKLIKALAGNDECKSYLIQKEYTGVILDHISLSMDSAPTVTAGLAAVAALTLRSPENSKAFYEQGIADVIITAMQQHHDQKSIQKTASWAIRNMVSRSKNQIPRYLELGIEAILHKNLKEFKDIEYDTKAALRDLGCKVNLKEEWTGKGGAITTGILRNGFEY